MKDFNVFACEILCESVGVDLQALIDTYSDYDDKYISEEVYKYLTKRNINEGVSDTLSGIKNWFSKQNIIPLTDIKTAQALENYLIKIKKQIFDNYVNERQSNMNYPLLRNANRYIKMLTKDELERIITYVETHRTDKETSKHLSLNPHRFSSLGDIDNVTV